MNPNVLIALPIVIVLIATAAPAAGPVDGVTDSDLAGESLVDYPYFHYVDTFNPGTSVHLAIDPTGYSELPGQTCDI